MENAGRDKDRGNDSCGLYSSTSKFFFLPKIVDVEFLSLANKSPASFKSEFILVLPKKKSGYVCVSVCSLKHGNTQMDVLNGYQQLFLRTGIEGSKKDMGFPGGASGKEPACQCRKQRR